MTPEETAAALTKAEEERDAALAKLEKAEQELKDAKQPEAADPVKPEPAPIDKSELPEPVRAALEKAEAENAANLQRLEKAEKDAAESAKLAKAERDARIEREFITKAENDFPHLGKAEDLGPRLKRMSETLSKDDFDAHLNELKAANARIETGELFAELGKSGDPAPEGTGSGELAEITRKAEELRKSDSGLTEYSAMQLAMRDSREAQARYLQANR